MFRDVEGTEITRLTVAVTEEERKDLPTILFPVDPSEVGMEWRRLHNSRQNYVLTVSSCSLPPVRLSIDPHEPDIEVTPVECIIATCKKG